MRSSLFVQSRAQVSQMKQQIILQTNFNKALCSTKFYFKIVDIKTLHKNIKISYSNATEKMILAQYKIRTSRGKTIYMENEI